MLAFIGFSIIVLFLVAIMSKKLSVMTALVIIPVVIGLLAGFKPTELGKFALEGIKQVAPTEYY